MLFSRGVSFLFLRNAQKVTEFRKNEPKRNKIRILILILVQILPLLAVRSFVMPRDLESCGSGDRE